MSKFIITMLLLNISLFSTEIAQASATDFDSSTPIDLITEYSQLPKPKHLGNVTLKNGIKLPAYQLYYIAGYSDKDYETQAPKSLVINKTLKSEYQKDLVVYYFDDRWFLLPKNWQVMRAIVGGNGSMALDVSAPHAENGKFHYWTNNGGCAGCGIQVASTFFKQADVLNQQDYGGQPNYHHNMPNIKSVTIRPYTEAWRTSVDGKYTDGLAYFNEEDYLIWTTSISLPKSQQTLATPILNWFLPPKP